MGSWVSSPPKTESNLAGKVVVITGASRGIGLETAKQLYKLGATVYLGVRTEEKAIEAIEQIQAGGTESVGQLKWFPLDLSTIKGSRESAERFLKLEKQLDILINNAAALADHPFTLNEDGIETIMAVNHFGHFVFTMTLLDLMKQTSKQAGADVRIVTLASGTHSLVKQVSFERNSDLSETFPVENPNTWMNTLVRYARSKLANILFTSELQRRLDAEGFDIIVISLNPGNVRTDSAIEITSKIPILGPLAGFFASYLLSSVPDGAYTSVFVAANPIVRAEPGIYKGKYLVPFGKIGVPSPLGQDTNLAKQLWTLSETVIAANGSE